MTEKLYIVGYTNNVSGKVDILSTTFTNLDKQTVYSYLIRPLLYKENYENFAYDIELKKGITRISKNLEIDCKIFEDDEVQIILNNIVIERGYIYNNTKKTLLFTFFVKNIKGEVKEEEKPSLEEEDKSIYEEITFESELKEKVKKYPIMRIEPPKQYEKQESDFQRELHEAVQKRESTAKAREFKKKNKRNLKRKL